MAQEPDGWERELIERMLVGDERALAMAFDQYAPVVYGVAARLIGADAAADVCQEVFLALRDHPDRYDPQRSTLRSFLIMIARRRCIDHLRRHGRREATEQAAGRRVDGPTPPNVDEAALAMIAGQRVLRSTTCPSSNAPSRGTGLLRRPHVPGGGRRHRGERGHGEVAHPTRL
ncbi:MAG: sigma-70 family RNA polymerase sigma factor [Acidimicrobiales bacterium]